MQYAGPVRSELLSLPHYLGGRVLRVERSRVKSMGGMRMLLVEGLGNVGRRQVFSQFKRYGYVLGMEVGWGMAWIQYDCAEAVDKAIRANVNDAME